MKPTLRLLFALGLIVPVTLVGSATALTLVYHLAACPLCILQRILYLLVALASGAGLLSVRSDRLRRFAALTISTSSLGGGTIAAYQIHLQRNPFSATCGDGTSWWERAVAQAGEFYPPLFKAEGLCSDSTWSLFGLTIVEWSFLAFTGLFLLGVILLFIKQRRQS